MDNSFKFLLLLILIVIMAFIPVIKDIIKIRKNVQKKLQKVQQQIGPQIQSKYPYKKANLLTKTEYSFYKILKEECDKRNLLICPKVRMEDFLEVTCKDEQLKYRGYIKSRHIDFMICDQDLRILCGIELDDPSHYTQKAQKADTFKNDVFKEIGLPLYRIKTGHGSYKEQLEAAFYVLKQKEAATTKPEEIKKDSI